MPDYPYLAKVDDPELRSRIRKVMAAFELQSDVRGAAIGSDSGHTKPDSKPPAGAFKPMRERSLFERYSAQFAQCLTRPDPQWAFRLLCAHAERDLEHSMRPPREKEAGAINHLGDAQGRDGAAVERERNKEIVTEFEGAPAGEVAAILQVTTGVVRKARRDNGCSEETGLRKEGWAGWDEETRFRKVQEAKSRVHSNGKPVSQQWVANDLGTSKRSVQRRWERPYTEQAAA